MVVDEVVVVVDDVVVKLEGEAKDRITLKTLK